MLTAQDNATIARDHFNAFNARDLEKGLTLVTKDAKWMNIPFDREFTGHAGYREFHNNWTTAMPDCKVEIVNVIGGEEWTVVEFIGRGTHTGPLAGPQDPIPATHKKLGSFNQKLGSFEPEAGLDQPESGLVQPSKR